MHDDDAQIGRILSRRETLALFGFASVSLLGFKAPVGADGKAARALPSCVVKPEQTEGPYFVDVQLDRRDIRSDPETRAISEGVPLELQFEVTRVTGTECAPLPNALVDVWQCDGLGIYSDVRDTNARFNTVGQKFLRGHQRTDMAGNAQFTTIYPGWYQGRTIHIHFKIRVPSERGGAYDFTSQLYFDDALSDRVFEQHPYTRNTNRRVRNEQDGIFRSGGDQLMVTATPKGTGYAAMFAVGLQLDG